MLAEYYQSKECYYENFKKHFEKHYKKIPKYKEILSEAGIANLKTDKFISGFFIENFVPPLYEVNGKLKGELYLPMIKQFVEIFVSAEELDYILYGFYFNGRPQLVYIDRKYLPPFNELINIENEELSFSNLNYNQCDIYNVSSLGNAKELDNKRE